MKEEVRIFAPATVANVNCGFDALGFALNGIGDEMVIKKTKSKEVIISTITGPDQLPIKATENVAGVAAIAMLEGEQLDFGVCIEIYKKIRCGSGIGSSAASAAGVVFGINQLLDQPISNLALTRYAMKGEALASGNEHADNVAPCIFGGITLVTGYSPFNVLKLPTLSNLHVGIIHPYIKISTKESREILPKNVPLQHAIKQAQNLASFVASLYEWNKNLFAQSLNDVLVEPHRKNLMPHFDRIKKLSVDNNCIAFGISGSGPSMFAFALKKEDIDSYLVQASTFYASQNLQVDTHSSTITANGCSIIE